MRKLIISFTALVGQLTKGMITEAELEDALFYFGCVRNYVLNTDISEIVELNWHIGFDDEVLAERQRVFNIIVKVVKKAEKEGRAVFRENVEEHNSYEKLNKLLVANGYAPLEDAWDSYNYSGVEVRVEALKLPLTVISHSRN